MHSIYHYIYYIIFPNDVESMILDCSKWQCWRCLSTRGQIACLSCLHICFAPVKLPIEPKSMGTANMA